MLESLGYAEAAARAEADLILFNTCSIREKADERFVAHLGEARALKRARPERVIGVGGCWAQSVKDEVFRRFPFVDVAFGPGQVHKLAEFLTSDSLTAQGYFEFEGFTGPAAREARARGSRPGCRSRSAATAVCSYCIVPSTRGREVVAAGRRAGRRGAADGRRGRARGHAARPERQLLRARPAPARARSRELLRAGRRDRRHRPDPLHEPAPQGHARGRRRARTPSCRRCASTSTCRCSRARRRILKRMRRTYDARALPGPRRAASASTCPTAR